MPLDPLTTSWKVALLQLTQSTRTITEADKRIETKSKSSSRSNAAGPSACTQITPRGKISVKF